MTEILKWLSLGRFSYSPPCFMKDKHTNQYFADSGDPEEKVLKNPFKSDLLYPRNMRQLLECQIPDQDVRKRKMVDKFLTGIICNM